MDNEERRAICKRCHSEGSFPRGKGDVRISRERSDTSRPRRCEMLRFAQDDRMRWQGDPIMAA